MAVELPTPDESEHSPAYVRFRERRKQQEAEYWAEYWRRRQAEAQQTAATIAPDTHSGR